MRHLSLVSKHLPLGDTEPVLLVGDDEGKVIIDYLLLDQGVGSDDDIRFMGGNFLVGDPLFLCRHGTSEQDHLFVHTMLLKEFRHRLEVLSRENFRRHHESSLVSVLAGCQERQNGDDRLTGANITLDQPVHDGTALEVLQDFLQRPQLGVREPVRQIRQKLPAFILFFHMEWALHILTFLL